MQYTKQEAQLVTDTGLTPARIAIEANAIAQAELEKRNNERLIDKLTGLVTSTESYLARLGLWHLGWVDATNDDFPIAAVIDLDLSVVTNGVIVRILVNGEPHVTYSIAGKDHDLQSLGKHIVIAREAYQRHHAPKHTPESPEVPTTFNLWGKYKANGEPTDDRVDQHFQTYLDAGYTPANIQFTPETDYADECMFVRWLPPVEES